MKIFALLYVFFVLLLALWIEMPRRFPVWKMVWKGEVSLAWIRTRSWFELLPHNLKVWYPLRVLKYLDLDEWYATKILGWEFDAGHAFDWSRHFHTKSGAVVRPSDYGGKPY